MMQNFFYLAILRPTPNERSSIKRGKNVWRNRFIFKILNLNKIKRGAVQFLFSNSTDLVPMHLKKVTSQITIICWANAGILSAVLLARSRQMTLARCHFAINCQPLVRCWSNARIPTTPAYANVMPTIIFQVRWPDMICGHHLLILIV